ncbi:hypothetical protein [Janthinobacterium sp. J1-1]|uniref:hypothetical protein n=1 Tax=unclassified Janthinobacterium TaxID=2610881 RepID=UPI0028113E9F|nr:hypothetical protein [Janthinobacterium sp. J1-1]
MGFAEQFIASLSSRNLRDDAVHHDLDVIAAAALAGDMGALLCRVKYADGTVSRVFEGNAGNLAQLLRAWTAAVAKKGQARRWVKARTAWDAQAANTLYRRVAEASLAHWLDSKCKVCHGTGVVSAGTAGAPLVCKACHGAGVAAITCSGGFELERIKDMVSELEAIFQSHGRRAMRRLGR